MPADLFSVFDFSYGTKHSCLRSSSLSVRQLDQFGSGKVTVIQTLPWFPLRNACVQRPTGNGKKKNWAQLCAQIVWSSVDSDNRYFTRVPAVLQARNRGQFGVFTINQASEGSKAAPAHLPPPG